MSGENSPPKANTMTAQEAQMAGQLQQMLAMMEQNMLQMQDAVLGKLDQMTERIGQLEKSLNTVMTHAGIDPEEIQRQVNAEMAQLEAQGKPPTLPSKNSESSSSQ
jgi:division protein CdvB (Snf7/Vps24/ESCRT-III family)